MLLAPQIEAIERATVAGVAPDEVREVDGWLVCLDASGMGRATSAVPLGHEAHAEPALIARIEALYRAGGLRPAFRVADVAGLEPVRAELARRGYQPGQPTIVKVGEVAAVRALSPSPAEVASAPDAAWAAAFQGDGFDPADSARRLGNLTRAPGSVFAAVREDGVALAVGVASFGFGWAGVHGMRTHPARRGEGLAGRVLSGLASAAAERGLADLFLQVEEPNAPARALYRRAGLRAAWRYRYWR